MSEDSCDIIVGDCYCCFWITSILNVIYIYIYIYIYLDSVPS